jgi:hypothetical protein
MASQAMSAMLLPQRELIVFRPRRMSDASITSSRMSDVLWTISTTTAGISARVVEPPTASQDSVSSDARTFFPRCARA